MTGGPRAGNGDRLSPQTLGIASVASATAALITSRLWAPGTAFAAALTPVIVSIVSELLQRPAQHVSRLRVSRRADSRARIEPGGYERPRVRGPAPETPTARATSGSRRRPRVKIALVTGVIAFAIAAAALTLPELIFGKAVATNRHTTIFGGAPPEQQAPQPTPTTPQTTQTAPSQKPPSTTTATTSRTSPPPKRPPRPIEAPPPAQTAPTP